VTVQDDDPVISIDVGGNAGLTIAKDGAVSIKSQGDVKLEGNQISIEAQGQLTLKGATVNIN
jgi:hypothetical protein